MFLYLCFNLRFITIIICSLLALLFKFAVNLSSLYLPVSTRKQINHTIWAGNYAGAWNYIVGNFGRDSVVDEKYNSHQFHFFKSSSTWYLASQSGPTSSFDTLQIFPSQSPPRRPDLNQILVRNCFWKNSLGLFLHLTFGHWAISQDSQGAQSLPKRNLSVLGGWFSQYISPFGSVRIYNQILKLVCLHQLVKLIHLKVTFSNLAVVSSISSWTRSAREKNRSLIYFHYWMMIPTFARLSCHCFQTKLQKRWMSGQKRKLAESDRS